MQYVKTQEDLLQFLKDHDVATLATVKLGNIAHAATIFYHVDDLLSFYFLTKDSTVKFSNVKENHTVALVITDAEVLQTVQIEGTAKEVDYSKEYASTIKEFTDKLQKNGRQWEDIPINHVPHGYFAFVKVSPLWIRWSDFKDWKHVIQFEWQAG